MERLARFVVKKRKAIYVVTAVLAVLCAAAIPFVTINSDMTRYLPEQSRIRQGFDAMNEEFPQLSPLEVMYTGLTDEQVQSVADDLAALSDVDGVTYVQGTEADGNADKTLFTVNLVGGTYSDTAAEGLAAVRSYTEGSGAALAGAVIDGEDLFATLGVTIALAVAILLVILFVMCGSWAEPLPFTIAIGVAIVLNMGTNVVFPSVSNITFSIAAVLQLAFSMDYSIMLMDRYRQERAVTNDPEHAMVQTLGKGFAPIASSSVTTIAGMLCLVVMTFTIGRDMGLVLAKGVAFSLLSVLFLLPGLIVSFDTAIQKTAKRSPRPRLAGLARASYAGRYAILGVFALLLVVGFVAKGSAGISFFMESSNEDEQVINAAFAPTEQVVVLYEGSGEPVAQALDQIAALPGVSSMQAFETTLGKPYTADQIAEELGVEPAVAAALFYDYQGGGAGRMTVAQFASFVQNDLASLEGFSDAVSDQTRAQMEQLATFADPASVREQRDAASMAQAISLDPAAVEQLYLYYHVQNGGVELGTMTLPEFTSFVSQTVAADPQAASSFTDDQLAQIEQLAALADVAAVTAPLDANDLAAALGLDPSVAQQVYQLKALQAGAQDAAAQMSVQEFLAFVLDDVAANPQFADALDEATLSQLHQARAVVDASVAGVSFGPGGMAEVLGMDLSQLEQIYLLRSYQQGGDSWTLSLYQFVPFLVSEAESGQLAAADGATAIDEARLDQLKALSTIMQEALTGVMYTPEALADLLASLSDELDATQIDLIYLLEASQTDGDPTATMTLEQFVTFVADDVAADPRFSSALDSQTLAELQDAKELMAQSKDQLVGDRYQRAVLQISYDRDSDEMLDLLDDIDAIMADTGVSYHLVGDAPMGAEMQETFGDEFNFITLLTAGVIFLIVALTFRSFFVPLVLVLLIQTAINLTMGLSLLQGVDTYYIALMVVQALLMGATIDYAILFTSYYRDLRQRHGVKESLARSFRGSVGTIMTSSSILVLVTFVVGLINSDVTIAEVCLTISKGSFVAVTLVMLLLPGTLAALDRFVAGPKRTNPDGSPRE